MTNKLSHNAIMLLALLKASGDRCIWESDCAVAIFNRPSYQGNEKEYWQWEANCYGNKQELTQWGVFLPTVEKSYTKQISEAYQELRKLNLAGEKNNGYNEYALYAI